LLNKVDRQKRNERKFDYWEQKDEGRIYFLEVNGKLGWKARYVKVVDADENTVSFYQEIYNSEGKLVETHEKFPEDKGHKKL
jgi:hypothetical protein